MAIDTTSTTSTSTATTSKSATALNTLSEDYTAFLQLLTAQISNQDPLAPMDSTAFVSQLAQLTQVEQSVQTNSQLETIAASLSATSALSGVNLIGRTVTVETSTIGLAEGTSSFSYALEAASASTTAVIKDSSGNVVRTITGLQTGSGTLHDLTWDGTNDAGATVADGAYTVTINAVDSAGTAVATSTYAGTTVQGVIFDSTGPVLQLGNGTTAAMSDVLAVI